MAQRQRRGATHAGERTMHDQEVLRANKELAAYFKGQRTEREARAALKIIKAFVRGREETDPKTRPPLPGHAAPKAARTSAARKTSKGRKRRRAPEDVSPSPEPNLATPSE